jgi:hypothetical protein
MNNGMQRFIPRSLCSSASSRQLHVARLALCMHAQFRSTQRVHGYDAYWVNYYKTMNDMIAESRGRLGEMADSIVAKLGVVDRKVDEMARARTNEPDTMGDKIFKAAVPALAGLIAGKVFQTLWHKGIVKRRSNDSEADERQGLLLTLLFAGLSSAFGAVISQLSDAGSQAFVEHRHIKRAKRSGER